MGGTVGPNVNHDWQVWRLWIPFAEESVGETYQDRAVRQECSSDVQNPSERDMANQLNQASAIFAEFDEETSLLPSLMQVPTPQGVHALQSLQSCGGSSSNANATEDANKRKPKQSSNPLVEAAKFRARTARDFMEVEKLLKKSQADADKALGVALKAHDNNHDAVDADVSLDLLRSRLDLVNKVLVENNMDQEQESAESTSADLHRLAMEDPYLRDLQSSILQDSSCCQTFSMLKYARTVSLDV